MLSLAIALNVALDVAVLIALLVALSSARLLRPHGQATATTFHTSTLPAAAVVHAAGNSRREQLTRAGASRDAVSAG